MKKFKKLTTLLLITVLFVQSMNGTIMADSTQEEVSEEPLRYTYISSISVGLAINGGIASTSANLTVKGNHNSRIIVKLLRSTTANGSYSTYAGWSKSFSGAGTKVLNKSFSVPRGYTYRLKVVAKIYNSSGDVIETATKYSIKVSYY